MRPLLPPVVNVAGRSRQVALQVSLMPDTGDTVFELLMMGEIPPETC